MFELILGRLEKSSCTLLVLDSKLTEETILPIALSTSSCRFITDISLLNALMFLPVCSSTEKS